MMLVGSLASLDKPRDRELVSVVEIDGDHFSIDIRQLYNPAGSSVDLQVQVPTDCELSAVIFKRGPVPAVEGLPLRGNIDKPK